MDYIKDLLAAIGKEELGQTILPANAEFEGLAIAIAERLNGKKSYVLVENMGKMLAVKSDPKCMTSPIRDITGILSYEKVEPEKEEKTINKLSVNELDVELIKAGLSAAEVKGLTTITSKRRALEGILSGKLA